MISARVALTRGAACSRRPWLGALLVAAAHAFPAGAADQRAAEALVFLVQYIGVDYGLAVRDDRITDAFEYREMVTFSARAIEEYERLTGGAGDPATRAGLRHLEGLIQGLGPATDVRAEAARLVTALIAEFGVPAAPLASPDLDRGRALFESGCAPCHGPLGAGDGFGDPEMAPPPGSFRGERMNLISPHQVANAIRFGIDGTAMPAYEGAWSKAEMWDVAFWLLTLRTDFDPAGSGFELPVSLGELARSSNDELLARYEGDFPTVQRADVDRLRAAPPPFRPEDAPAAAAAAPPATPSSAAPLDLDADVAFAARLESAFSRVAAEIAPGLAGVTIYARVPDDAEPPAAEAHWTVPEADLNRYPGYRPVAIASGFFLTADGWVVTARSALLDPGTGQPAELIDIEQADNRHDRARLVAAEPTVDLALLKIEPRSPTVPVRLGDGAAMRVGHWALALADPPGVQRSFIAGTIASRPVRDCYQELRLATLIQTSLRVQRHSFGGPLANIRGEVIGLLVPRDPTAPTGTAPEEAYALPIDLVLTLFEPLRLAESRRSPWLGIAVQNLDWRLRRQLAAAPRTGIWAENVFQPSPAWDAGLRPGDFLVRVGDQRMLAVEDYQRAIYLGGIGATVDVEVFRDGETTILPMTIVERPANALTR